ncbi:MAG: nucleotidyltransferase domain-containing protein [Chloroflexi bacterium]|nr:nucleotidyltransferase domain-containing protein [Chloroflexota bacterium]
MKAAEGIASVASTWPGVSCIFITGSVATGLADQKSDVDITVVTQRTVPRKAQRRILRSLGTGWTFNTPPVDNPIWAEVDRCRSFGGVPVEVHYQTAAFITSVLDQVIRRGALRTQEVPFRPYTVAGMIRTARLLHDGDGMFRRWMKRTRRYPRRLKRNILAHFLPILESTARELRGHAQRRLGPSGYIYLLHRSADAMRSVLYALNEVYDSADRRTDLTVLPKLAVVPERFHGRYAHVLGGPFTDAEGIHRAAAWQRLAADVIALGTGEKHDVPAKLLNRRTV